MWGMHIMVMVIAFDCGYFSSTTPSASRGSGSQLAHLMHVYATLP